MNDRHGLGCAGALCACSMAMASPTIVYVDIVDQSVSRLPAAFDLNMDGVTDFTVFRGESTVAAITGSRDENRVLALSVADPFALLLAPDFSIGESDEDLRLRTANLALLICEAAGSCSWFGPFPQTGTPGFIGFEFLIDDMVHFGWMRIQVAGVNGIPTIFDFAYESRPGAAIRAGQVPAPASAGVALIGLAMASARRRR